MGQIQRFQPLKPIESVPADPVHIRPPDCDSLEPGQDREAELEAQFIRVKIRRSDLQYLSGEKLCVTGSTVKPTLRKLYFHFLLQ